MVAALLLPILAACFCLAGHADLKHEPWLSKDWRQWTSDDTVLVLNSSPWSHPTSQVNSPGCGPGLAYQQTLVQFRSALPIRQALLRQAQLQKHYDKMDVQKKQEFDQQHAIDLTDGANGIVKIVINNSSITPQSAPTDMNAPAQPCVTIPPEPATQASVWSSGGVLIPPTRITKVNYTSTRIWESMNQFEYIFPRTISGKPLFSPKDRLLGISLGAPLIVDKKTGKVEKQDFQSSGLGYTFEISDLMYKGKLEY
jgi:hypothetical protein